MPKTCPICGTSAPPEARFCRRCGTPLRVAGGAGQDVVSPQAATVPLSDEVRPTEGLWGEDRQPRPAPETTRVNRAELDAIMRSARPDGAKESGAATVAPHAPDAEYAAPGASPHETSEGAPAEPPRADTSPHLGEETEEELTITVPRPAVPFAETTLPAKVERSPDRAAAHETNPAASAASLPAKSATPGTRPKAAATPARRLWAVVGVVCAGLLLLGVAAAWLASSYWRRAEPAASVNAEPPPVAADPVPPFDEKLAEAESLLAAGDREGAVARLREANLIDPANTRAHRRLGELLLEGGARREAIEEFRALVANAPDDFTAWRALATAQFAEGLYAEAAESYRRLFALTGEGGGDASDLLSYADALRQSGRAEEARAVYQRLAALPAGEASGVARQRLAEMASASASASPTPARGGGVVTETARPEGVLVAPSPSPTIVVASATPPPTPPTPAPTPPPAQTAAPATPAERYRRGVELWGANRGEAVEEFRAAAAAGNPEAHYYLGLSLIEGRNLRGLKRAEVVAALEHFQRAQRGGFAPQARRYAQQLEREFDRLRNQ